MYKKLNYKWLAGILIILLAIFLITELSGPKKHSEAFPEVLAAVDTTKITELNIACPGKEEVNLVREKGTWYVLIDGKKLSTDKNVVDRMLKPILHMTPQKLAATKKADWEKYDLAGDEHIHVWAKEGNKEVANFYVGNFSYVQPTEQEIQVDPRLRNQPGLMTTYVRVEGRDEVYGVNDFLKLTYDKEPKHFRDKTIAQLDFNEIRTVNFNYPATNSTLSERILNGLLMVNRLILLKQLAMSGYFLIREELNLLIIMILKRMKLNLKS